MISANISGLGVVMVIGRQLRVAGAHHQFALLARCAHFVERSR